MRRSCIMGVGRHLPETVVTNADLERVLNTTDEWIVRRTGIRERRWVERGSRTAPSDLALRASERAIERAGIPKEKIGMIIFGTLHPDHYFPGSGVILQAKLGLPGIPALDIRMQCSSFIYGLSIADQYVKSGMVDYALVVGAEVQSAGIDLTPRGRDMAVIFGDGAGAAVVGPAPSDGESLILSTHLHSDGRFANKLWVEAPGATRARSWGEPANRDDLEGGLMHPRMDGKFVFLHAVQKMPEVAEEALAANGLAVGDIDWFVPHQANLRICEAARNRLKIPDEKVINTIEKHGNTTAASIPICLAEAVEDGRLKKGDLVCLAAFGSGFTWASALLRW